MTKNYQIVITGASGFVAKNLRKFFSDKEIKLVSISRKNFRKYKNEIKVVSPIYDEKVIFPIIRNSDALIHLVGIGKQSVNIDFHQINVEITKKIINLCLKSKIPKIVFTSGLGVTKNASIDYFISKYHAENQIIQSGLNFTIFRPSYIIGKDDLLTTFLKNQIKKKEIQIPGSGKYSFQPIYINDVCKIIFESITNKKFNNKTLDLVGSELITYFEYVKLFSRKKNIKFTKINLEKAYHDAITNPSSTFSLDDLNLLIGDFRGNHENLKKISNCSFTSVRKILKSGGLF